TYRVFSSGLKSSAVGWEPGASGSSGRFSVIFLTTVFPVRSSSATCDAFHKLHQARRASRVATQVYGKDDGTKLPVLRSKVCKILSVVGSSTTTLSERLLATRSLSRPASVITANPAGYGIAVCGGAFKPTACFFAVDSG